MIIRWYWGESGSGKTRAVFSEFAQDQVFQASSYSMWMDGISPEKHKCILYECNSLTDAKRILKCQKNYAPIKGQPPVFIGDMTVIICVEQQPPPILIPRISIVKKFTPRRVKTSRNLVCFSRLVLINKR